MTSLIEIKKQQEIQRKAVKKLKSEVTLMNAAAALIESIKTNDMLKDNVRTLIDVKTNEAVIDDLREIIKNIDL